MFDRRSCGVLLHPTSLPGSEGIGTLGRQARRFVDLLSGMGMSIWQMLPLTPPACGNSPYSAFSAFAGNPLLIDLEQIVLEGDLTEGIDTEELDDHRVNFSVVEWRKLDALERAAAAFFAAGRTARMEEFWHFCDTNDWLHTYALFMALKKRYRGQPWPRWPREFALLEAEGYEKASVELGSEIGVQKYMQWQFHRQWERLHSYARTCGVSLVGDLPIFVAYDSADVWSNRSLFLLNEDGTPTEVAGVPPDYFSATGQLWGNPLYNWDVLAGQDYDWWIRRMRQLFILFDAVRIDHFRGFEAAWHVPAKDTTAVNGQWIKGPGSHFFDVLNGALGRVPIIAEDLGVITPEVVELLQHCGYPGMKILQFAFDSGPDKPYLPHKHVRNCIVYTGTHDNDTTRGWYESIPDSQAQVVRQYIGCDNGSALQGMIRMALMSVANTAILPFQDLLGLPASARMNIPGTAADNWGWRFTWDMVPRSLGPEFREMLNLYGRS